MLSCPVSTPPHGMVQGQAWRKPKPTQFRERRSHNHHRSTGGGVGGDHDQTMTGGGVRRCSIYTYSYISSNEYESKMKGGTSSGVPSFLLDGSTECLQDCRQVKSLDPSCHWPRAGLLPSRPYKAKQCLAVLSCASSARLRRSNIAGSRCQTSSSLQPRRNPSAAPPSCRGTLSRPDMETSMIYFVKCAGFFVCCQAKLV